MKRRILSIGMVAVVVALLSAFAAPTSAQAASAPTTSPAAASRVFQSNADFECATGYACAVVPYGSGYYVFKFYYYGTYYLSNWFGYGVAFNSQSGGAAMRLLNGGGGQLECIHGIGSDGLAHWDDNVNWDPIYRVQLTSSNC